jgi:glycosyltransferase involved in cell wall biosynthesis
MKVSVIIPVFNAEPYLRQAVFSALQQPETGEVLLIEDGSTDESLVLCRRLDKRHGNVRLLRHADGQNLGAGASRNLGIRKANFPFIAFLDADDFYLRRRFSIARKLFGLHSNADGVYEATGVKFENEEARTVWQLNPLHRGNSITTITEVLSPEELFEALVLDKRGSFTTNAIVVRKRIFDRTGLFDEDLKLHQDTAMWIKMAAVARLHPGRLKRPVAIRRVHDSNRITKVLGGYSPARKKLNEALCNWAKSVDLPNDRMRLLRYRRWRDRFYNHDIEVRKAISSQEGTLSLGIKKKITYLSRKLITDPSLVLSPHFSRFCLNAVRGLSQNSNRAKKPF